MNFRHKASLKGHKAAVYALCEGETATTIFSGGSDRNVLAWDLENMGSAKLIARAATTIISLCYIKELNYLLIGQIEGGVHILDLKEGKEVTYLKYHQGYIFDLSYLPGKRELVCASGDGSISIWSVPNFKLLYHKRIGTGKNRKLCLSPNQEEMAISSADKQVVLMSTEDWSTNVILDNFESGVNVVSYHPTKEQLLVGEKDAYLNRVDLYSREIIDRIPAHYWAIYDICFSPDGRFFATASRDKTVKIWDSASHEVLKRFEGLKDQGHTHSVNALLWCAYDNYLLSAGDDRSVKVWEVLA
jgi:WD40 repeat protein